MNKLLLYMLAITTFCGTVYAKPGPLAFSASPSDAEIGQARIFSIPLLKTEDPGAVSDSDPLAPVKENRALAAALLAYSKAQHPEDVSALTRFLERYPATRWRPSLLGHLGLVWRRSGRFQNSIDAFEEAWTLTRNGQGRHTETIANWAFGELAHMHAHLGHGDRIETLYTELNGRKLSGPATEQWTAAFEALAQNHQHPEGQARCGPMALAVILRSLGREVPDFLLEAPATQHGFSMTALAKLAERAGMDLQPIKRSPGSPVPVGSVVHWKVDHYSAIVDRRTENGRQFYLVENPLFEKQIWVSQEVLDQETSGYVLAPTMKLPQGWRLASQGETDAVWGGCWSGKVDLLQLMLDAVRVAVEQALCQSGGTPMAQYSFHAMLVSLHLEDTPVGYSPPVGPEVPFQVVYNQRDTLQPADLDSYANLGAKWTFNWLSYVMDTGPRLDRDVTVYLRGGGGETYPRPKQVQGPISLGINYQSQAELVALGEDRNNVTGYERRLPDGSKEIFGLPKPLSGRTDRERRVFLTEVVDRAGNSVKLSYDASFRIVAITDAIGQVTRVSYDLPEDPRKVTQVTDPFGRSATFAYNAERRLVRITDVIGITSDFTYDGDFVTSLTTPYGTTTFRTGSLTDLDPSLTRFENVNRWLEATDPLGDTERLEIRATRDGFRNQPSTITLYWDKPAWRAGGRNDANARIYRWMLLDATILSGVPRLIKPALESAVVYSYPGQPTEEARADHLRMPASDADGLPATITKTLEENTRQTQQFEYNVRGKVIKSTDPVGRTFVFDYDTNGIDLLEVRNDLTNDRLVRISYNSQHLPVTMTDAALQTTRFSYNARGQVLTITNAKGETTTFTYDDDGYLTTIVGPVPTHVNRFTYDEFGRVHTVTDPEGYRLVFEYDALDRPTKLIYPDGTFEEARYDRLDPIEWIDRQGRSTTVAYDALRRAIAVTDPLGRVIRKSWCNCGSIEQFTDPAGNVTTWERDLRGRLIEKVLADGASTSFAYGPQSGRLLQVIDPKGQLSRYDYTLDGNLRRITFQNAIIPTAPIIFTYDPNYDRLVSVEDGVGTTNYTYHPERSLGALQLASVTGQLAASRIDYGYDELGRVVRRSINGVVAAVNYDVLGRIAQLNNALGQFAFTYTGETDRLQTIVYPNGQRSMFDYLDLVNDQRLRQLRHDGPDGGVLSQFDYTYETTGEIQTQSRRQVELSPSSTTYTYGYDAASQLTMATLTAEAGSILARYEYTYDEAGNRTIGTADGESRFGVFNEVNQLVSSQHGGTTRPFTYDANGNLLSNGVRMFKWDARDRLVAITQGNRRSEFTYDAFDRRVRVVEKANDTVVSDRWLLWCGLDICEQRVVREGISQTQKRFFGFGEMHGNRALFYTRDHVGSIRQITDSEGVIVAGYDYDPYGGVVERIGEVGASFGYADYYTHAPSQLYLAQYRAYDAMHGRWLSRDPIAEDGGLNLYGFVNNDPINLLDPDGLQTVINPRTGLPQDRQLAPVDLRQARRAGRILNPRTGGTQRQNLPGVPGNNLTQSSPNLSGQFRPRQQPQLQPSPSPQSQVNEPMYAVNTSQGCGPGFEDIRSSKFMFDPQGNVIEIIDFDLQGNVINRSRTVPPAAPVLPEPEEDSGF